MNDEHLTLEQRLVLQLSHALNQEEERDRHNLPPPPRSSQVLPQVVPHSTPRASPPPQSQFASLVSSLAQESAYNPDYDVLSHLNSAISRTEKLGQLEDHDTKKPDAASYASTPQFELDSEVANIRNVLQSLLDPNVANQILNQDASTSNHNLSHNQNLNQNLNLTQPQHRPQPQPQTFNHAKPDIHTTSTHYPEPRTYRKRTLETPKFSSEKTDDMFGDSDTLRAIQQALMGAINPSKPSDSEPKMGKLDYERPGVDSEKKQLADKICERADIIFGKAPTSEKQEWIAGEIKTRQARADLQGCIDSFVAERNLIKNDAPLQNRKITQQSRETTETHLSQLFKKSNSVLEPRGASDKPQASASPYMLMMPSPKRPKYAKPSTQTKTVKKTPLRNLETRRDFDQLGQLVPPSQLGPLGPLEPVDPVKPVKPVDQQKSVDTTIDTGNTQKSTESNESKEAKEANEQHEINKLNEPNASTELNESKEPKNPQNATNVQEIKDSQESKESKESKDLNESKESESKESQESQEPKEPKELKEPKEPQEVEPKEPQEVEGPQEPQGPKEPQNDENANKVQEVPVQEVSVQANEKAIESSTVKPVSTQEMSAQRCKHRYTIVGSLQFGTPPNLALIAAKYAQNEAV